MNCQEFNQRLYEYQDDPLGSEVGPGAREHLQQCSDCRRAVLREKALAQSIRYSLEGATENLSLRPEMLRNVFEAADSRPNSRNVLILGWQWLTANPFRPVSAGAVLLGALVLFISLPARHRPAENLASQAVPGSYQNAWIIDVPIRTQTHVFRRQNGMVIDGIVASTAFGQARFSQPKISANSL